MAYYNLEKLAADTDVLRRFARRHIWNAPHRDFGEAAEQAMAQNRGLRRQLRAVERAAARYPGSDEAQRELEARAARHREATQLWEKDRQAALDAWASDESEKGRRLLDGLKEKSRARAQRFIARGDDPAEVAEWLDEELKNLDDNFGALRNFREAPVLDTSPPANPYANSAALMRSEIERQSRIAAGNGRGSVAAMDQYNGNTIYLHGVRGGPGARLLAALHEDNERKAAQRIERAVGRTYTDSHRGGGGPMPNLALRELPQSSHMTPSVPLRDVNIANTAWGPDAENLQARAQEMRFTPRVRGNTEIEEIGQMVPGAQRILQNSHILPGARIPRTPGYVQYAQQRLIGAGSGAPPSDAVRERLQQIVDRHEASIEPASHPRLNRNELHMIDSAFHRKYNPEFPELLRKRVPSPQTPATPLPAEQRSAFREALAAQPGLTRKQFLAR